MTIQGLSAGFDYCYPIMAPQTEIPLTGEMSRSDKRVTARYEQLEPVTLNRLSSTAVASLYRNDKTIHRIVLSATDNSTRSVTAIRCRRRENCAEVPTETKKTAHRAIFLFGKSS